ncbi:unnamed protein product [Caenorhabditis angaria]|uniref:Rab-GAP TBC domain-containing protein n=1 Tax=Caenorhabditis angaria TaxID=860376 RepID=A0A9P1I945_9PELO|nr:unnamed protein product [Caenorhabditis angaria]
MKVPVISLDVDSDENESEPTSSSNRLPPPHRNGSIRKVRQINIDSNIGDCGTESTLENVMNRIGRSQSLRRNAAAVSSAKMKLEGESSRATSPTPSFIDFKPMLRTASLRVKQQLTTRLSEPLKKASKLLTVENGDDDQQFQHYSLVHGLTGPNNNNHGEAEDAGSSSEDEDDPEYLELMERDSIINRYEKGPDSGDVDAWENPDFDVYTKLDRFGFVHKEGEQFSEANEIQRRRILKELSREKKWLKMVNIWKSGGPSKKMEDRIWKGIPEKLRLVVWPRLLGAERMKDEKKDVYKDLLLRARLVSKDIKQIDLDINRTYRDHLAFRKRYDVKQKSLLNVLAAYSMYNTEVGYCQGMSQIAALFLMYLDEEEAFWCLHQLMVSPKHTMHGFFVPGFPKLQRFEEHFKKVLKKYKPRIYKHLEKQDIPYIYLTKWWFGCFLDRVPFPLAMRLWDVFLIEGDPILIAMSLNIMKMHEKFIRKSTMESFMEFIQNDIANNFGYSDDETMYSLRETLTKLKSDRQHVPPPPRPEDLSEVPTKALGPILQKPMGTIREEIHEIQSRRSRANSTGRSPYPKRKESARKGPPPVQHKFQSSQDSINKEVPFEIPSRRNVGSPSTSSDMNGRNYQSVQSSQFSNHHNSNSSRSRQETNGHSTPSMQRLRDERNGQMVLLSRASDSEGDSASPMKDSPNGWSSSSHQHYHQESKHSSSSNSRIIQTPNHVTRIELDGDISVI